MSRRTYSDLEQFDQYLNVQHRNGREPSWGSVRHDQLQEYIGSLRAKSYAEATVARKVAAVKSFFSYLTAESIVSDDPTDALSRRC